MLKTIETHYVYPLLLQSAFNWGHSFTFRSSIKYITGTQFYFIFILHCNNNTVPTNLTLMSKTLCRKHHLENEIYDSKYCARCKNNLSPFLSTLIYSCSTCTINKTRVNCLQNACLTDSWCDVSSGRQ
jgi:hypothetical protein